jgi:hypothetical protein
MPGGNRSYSFRAKGKNRTPSQGADMSSRRGGKPSSKPFSNHPAFYPGDPSIRVLPTWENASEKLKAHNFSMAMKPDEAYPFSLRLGQEVLSKAGNTPSFLTIYVRKRLKHHLDGVLGSCRGVLAGRGRGDAREPPHTWRRRASAA